MATAVWGSASNNGGTNVGFIYTSLVAGPLPAGARIERIIVEPTAMGMFVPSSSSPADHVPVYMTQTLKINSVEYPNRTIHRGKPLLKTDWGVLFDPTSGFGQNRVYSTRYYGGKQELGFDHKYSYGGAGKSAITVTLSGLYASLLAAPLLIPISYEHVMYILYYV